MGLKTLTKCSLTLMFFKGPNVGYVPVPKLVKIGTFKPPVAKEKLLNAQ